MESRAVFFFVAQLIKPRQEFYGLVGKSNLQRDYIPSLEVFWDQWLVRRKGSLGSNDSRILGVPSKPHKTVKQRDVQNLIH